MCKCHRDAPLGASPFLERLPAMIGRDPRPQKRGRKPRLEAEDAG